MEKHYSDVSSTWRSYEQILSELNLTEGDIKDKFILDLGSGGAGFAEGVKQNEELLSRVVSVDPNYNLATLSVENANLMNEAVKNITEQKLDAVAGLAENLPFKNETFDLVISNHAVPWHFAENTEKISKSIKEIMRVLKPGGEARLYPVETQTDRTIFDAMGGAGCSAERQGKMILIRKNLLAQN